MSSLKNNFSKYFFNNFIHTKFLLLTPLLAYSTRIATLHGSGIIFSHIKISFGHFKTICTLVTSDIKSIIDHSHICVKSKLMLGRIDIHESKKFPWIICISVESLESSKQHNKYKNDLTLITPFSNKSNPFVFTICLWMQLPFTTVSHSKSYVLICTVTHNMR
jgi:hypothetical protein